MFLFLPWTFHISHIGDWKWFVTTIPSATRFFFHMRHCWTHGYWLYKIMANKRKNLAQVQALRVGWFGPGAVLFTTFMNSSRVLQNYQRIVLYATCLEYHASLIWILIVSLFIIPKLKNSSTTTVPCESVTWCLISWSHCSFALVILLFDHSIFSTWTF